MDREIFFIAIDQGSSGTMSTLFDGNLRCLDQIDLPVQSSTPNYGWVEQDPWELVESVRAGVQTLVRRNPQCLENLEGIGLANQGESFLLWDRGTGQPVTQVISWQDSRSEEFCTRLKKEGKNHWFHQKTGLHLSAEWPALKVRQMRRTDSKLDERCRRGDIVFGQLDAWVLYVFTGGRRMASDHGTACRTGFYNLGRQGWDEDLLRFFWGDDLILPDLMDNVERVEDLDLGIGKKLPWIAGGLDQAVTLIGQNCTRPGEVKVTYGPCCACWMNTGTETILDDNLTTSVAYQIHGKPTYALAAEGGASGNVITWLLENFSTGWKLEALEEIARQLDDQKEWVFVPAFQGLSAPHWQEAKGILFGITSGTRPEHLLRAGLDAVACTVRDILDCMPKFQRLVLDGGMTANGYLVQRQADVLGHPVERAKEREGTLMGIAKLCAESLGIESEMDSAQKLERILPEPGGMEIYRRWKQAVETVIAYYQPDAQQSGE